MGEPGRSYLLRVCLPVLVGGGIYGLFRDLHVMMFNPTAELSMKTPLTSFPRWSALIELGLPAWISHSLPDGLWSYACVSFVLIYWREGPPIHRRFWLSIAILLALGFEGGQLVQILSGTFCGHDAMFSVAAVGLALLSESPKDQWAIRTYPRRGHCE